MDLASSGVNKVNFVFVICSTSFSSNLKSLDVTVKHPSYLFLFMSSMVWWLILLGTGIPA